MVSLEKVLRWAADSRWRIKRSLPAALLPWLEGSDPVLASCLNSEWELHTVALDPAHAELRLSASNGAALAVTLRYAADGSLDGELEMTAGGVAHSLRRGALAVMLGGKHDAYLCDRQDGATRMLLHLAYEPGGLGAASCSAYTEALRERVPKYLQALLPQEVALCTVTPGR